MSLRGLVAIVLILWLTWMGSVLAFALAYAAAWLPRRLAQWWLSETGFVAIVWPQWVFFGPILFRTGENGGLVLPYMWAGAINVAFWVLVAALFSVPARHLQRPAILFAAALSTVVGTVYAVRSIVPILGWKMSLEFP